MKIFYDGIDIHKYPEAEGITTNCTLMAGKCYTDYYNSISNELRGRPISFQVWEDDVDKIIKQIKEIHAIDSSIFVKIPIMNSEGVWNDIAIQFCIDNRIPINITAIYTLEQVERAKKLLGNSGLPKIISIFAGPISDTGVNPDPIIRTAKELFKNNRNTDILWAGCREVYSIERARRAGADIITVPDSIMEKLPSLRADLTLLSLERIKKFKKDATNKLTRI